MQDVVGRYRILEKLGEGGMGVVYSALDPDLGRKVAIKRIRQAGTDPSARKRLEREARAAASVNHPNVCQVYEVGEHAGDLFVAMELLEGESLAARIAKGPIPLRESVEIALAVLSALEALHRRRIVHRDLKPSNVFLTPNGIKLLDFGLALPMQEGLARTDTRLTQSGMLIGTPGFMAPELWSGGEIGPTADLFALGALLFEMLAGRPAFPGKNAMETYHAIVHEQPPALAGGDAVVAVDRAIQRALSKRAEDRPQTASAMADELRAALPLAVGTSEARVRAVTRLIVLPFRALRPDPDTDFLRYALADAIGASLAGIESLTVRSSATAARFSAEAPDLKAVAAEAQVDVVLLGTILRAGDRVRVGIQLVEAPGGALVRSETVDASMGDVFRLQDDLSRRIVESLAVELSRRDSKALQRDVPKSPEGYELFLRANAMSTTSGMLPAARDLYLQSLERDPTYAPAWARLGRAYRVIAKFGLGDAKESLAKAEQAFRRALALNPDLATAHNLFTAFQIEELACAPEAMVRLLERAPSHAAETDLFVGLVTALRFCGLLEASVAADRRARRIDPGVRTSVGFSYWMLGDYERAMRYDEEDARYLQHYSLPMLGREAEAIAGLRAVESRLPTGPITLILASLRAAVERDRPACARAGRALLDSSFHDPEGYFFLARSLARVGETDLGLDVLERTVRGGLHVPGVISKDPWFDSVRSTPRFAAALAEAEAGHRRAAHMYDVAGGERLLGVPAR